MTGFRPEAWGSSVNDDKLQLLPSVSPGYQTKSLPEWSVFNPISTSTTPTPPAEVPQVPKKIPRPPNAWILYRSNCIAEMRKNMPEGAPKPTQADLSKVFAEQWRNEAEEVKAEYERQSEAAREEHAIKYPDWKFQRKPPKVTTPELHPQHLPVRSDTGQPSLQLPTGKRDRPKSYEQSTFGPGLTKLSFHNAGTAVQPQYVPVYQNHTPFPPAPSMYAQPPRLPHMQQHYEQPPRQHQQPLHQESSRDYIFPGYADQSRQVKRQAVRIEERRGFPVHSGLESTLARRSSSAYNILNVASRTMPNVNAHTNTISIPELGSMEPGSASSVASTTPTSEISPPILGAHQGFDFPSKSHTHEQTKIMAPFAPFGVSPPNGLNEIYKTEVLDQQHALDFSSPSWYTAQTSGVTIPAATPFQSTQYPPELQEWLEPFKNVRVVQDDIRGQPLMDFLTSLSAQANVKAAEDYLSDKSDTPPVQTADLPNSLSVLSTSAPSQYTYLPRNE